MAQKHARENVSTRSLHKTINKQQWLKDEHLFFTDGYQSWISTKVCLTTTLVTGNMDSECNGIREAHNITRPCNVYPGLPVSSSMQRNNSPLGHACCMSCAFGLSIVINCHSKGFHLKMRLRSSQLDTSVNNWKETSRKACSVQRFNAQQVKEISNCCTAHGDSLCTPVDCPGTCTAWNALVSAWWCQPH